jgi:circadian clock protein KaiC
MLREQESPDLVDLLTDLFIRYKPAFVFVDSFKALADLFASETQRRTVAYDLATALAAYKCTSFLVGEYSQDMTTSLPEFAIVDVVLNLRKYSTNVREQRFLQVDKLRGSNSIPGSHAFSIRNEGIVLFPRLLSPSVSPSYEPKIERLVTGINGLDELVANGFWRGSTTLLAGPSGSGKTILALHFIREGILQDETVLYVGFQENPEQMARVMQNLGWDSAGIFANPQFELMYRSPVELQLDSVAVEIFGRVQRGNVSRVVVDSLGDLQRGSIDMQRFADFIYALTQWFAVENITAVMTLEVAEMFEIHRVSGHDISNMSDNMILLGYSKDNEMTKTFRIVKTRGSAHNSHLHRLEINNHGAAVKSLM